MESGAFQRRHTSGSSVIERNNDKQQPGGDTVSRVRWGSRVTCPVRLPSRVTCPPDPAPAANIWPLVDVITRVNKENKQYSHIRNIFTWSTFHSWEEEERILCRCGCKVTQDLPENT